ncbi:MAG: redox-sensing transcriptional repressor Rex [candidate division KSB1 bacterium]|nr:redox-sensing transcriptional repressor Rex [candidate division KSB1 bacterium]
MPEERKIEQFEIPKPAVARLCLVYRLLEELQAEGCVTVSSTQLGERLSMNSHNLRKDISYIGEVGNWGAGYEVARLKQAIGEKLGLARRRAACVVGLGDLGRAILDHAQRHPGAFIMAAGFDSNINKIETLKSSVPLFPAYQIPEVVRRLRIELAVITVPPAAAQKVADLLVEGGVRGLLNMTPAVIKAARPEVFLTNLCLTDELNMLSALITLNTKL